MSVDKIEELGKTRSYDYKESGWMGGDVTVQVVRKSALARVWIWVLAGVVAGLIIGMLGFLIWVCTGIWEDVGYVMEYGVGWYEDDAGELEIYRVEEDSGAGVLNGEGESSQLGK